MLYIKAMQPKISAVIPIRSKVAYLAQTLLSLQRQTVADWEAIVVDDHSEEDVAAAVAGFGDARVRYIRNEGKGGIGASRNLGNRAATAPLIAVVDSDDPSLPRRFEVSLDHFARYQGSEVFYGNLYTFKDGTSDLKAYKGFAPYDAALLFERDFIPHGATTYRRELLLANPYDEALSSAVDYDLFLRLTKQQHTFGWTEEPLALYRIHSSQTTFGEERSAEQRKNTELVQKRYR